MVSTSNVSAKGFVPSPSDFLNAGLVYPVAPLDTRGEVPRLERVALSFSFPGSFRLSEQGASLGPAAEPVNPRR
jgi:hypothetical protein